MKKTINEQTELQLKIGEHAGDGVVVSADWRDDGVKFTLMQPKRDKTEHDEGDLNPDNHIAFAYDKSGDLIPDKPTFDRKAVYKVAEEASTDDFKVEVEVVTP